jgi:ribosomal protein L7/L12
MKMFTTLLYGAVATLLLGIGGKYIETKYANTTLKDIAVTINTLFALTKEQSAIQKTTGSKKLVMLNNGKNQATVLATLRQITGVDYDKAKTIIHTAPSTVMTNISEEEAKLTKQALEFVGAECKII